MHYLKKCMLSKIKGSRECSIFFKTETNIPEHRVHNLQHTLEIF